MNDQEELAKALAATRITLGALLCFQGPDRLRDILDFLKSPANKKAIQSTDPPCPPGSLEKAIEELEITIHHVEQARRIGASMRPRPSSS